MAQQHPPAGHGHEHGESPLAAMMISLSGAGGPAHETGPPGANPLSVQAGHEPDRFQVRSILYVPAAVVATLVLAYLLVTWLFSAAANQRATDLAKAREKNPQVTALNEPSFSERVGRISSTKPESINGLKDTAVPQPRLEGLKQTRGDGANDPSYHRSKLPELNANNPRYIRPEDLRPENYVGRYLDPVSGQKFLAEYGWANREKRLVRVPINDYLKVVADKKLLPVRKDPVKVAATTEERAKPSNAGRGGPANPGPAPAATTPPAKQPKS